MTDTTTQNVPEEVKTPTTPVASTDVSSANENEQSSLSGKAENEAVQQKDTATEEKAEEKKTN